MTAEAGGRSAAPDVTAEYPVKLPVWGASTEGPGAPPQSGALPVGVAMGLVPIQVSAIRAAGRRVASGVAARPFFLANLRTAPARPVLVDDGDDDKHEAKQPKTVRP